VGGSLGDFLKKLYTCYNANKEVFLMNTVKGIYHDGIVELIEKPEAIEPAEVLVVFPQKKKKIVSIGGLFKKHNINYEAVDEELKKLNQETQKHIISELEN